MMKIFLTQFNSVLGDLKQNSRRIMEIISGHPEADVIVFPELAVTGYLPLDLIFNETFVDGNLYWLGEIAAAVKDQIVITGFIDRTEKKNPQGWPKRYNAAALLYNGKILHVFHKSLLPTYDVFDELRYFEPAREIAPYKFTFRGRELSIGVEICEDLWDDTYETKVTDILVRKGAELIINISASPFVREKVAVRRKIISETAARNGVPFLYCNLLGAQDELIYDGHCLAAGKTGEIKAAGKPFTSEGMEVIINDSGEPEGKVQREPETVESIYSALVLGIRDYIRKSGFSGVVLGISGGIDSALVAALAAAALGGENVTGILMPSRFSSDHSVTDAEKLAKNLGINARTVPINTLFEEYEKELSPFFSGLPFNVAEENLQARIRGNLVMAFSNKFGLLALATGNKTEFAMGYTTLYGDMCGALAPIGDLQKKLVYDISRFINEKAGYDLIPENILKKRPSAELRPDQFDPFDYDLMSPLVDEIIEHQATIEELVEKGYERELVENVFTAIAKTEFKRWQAPLILKISNYAFGIGRKMPIMNKFFGIAR